MAIKNCKVNGMPCYECEDNRVEILYNAERYQFEIGTVGMGNWEVVGVEDMIRAMRHFGFLAIVGVDMLELSEKVETIEVSDNHVGDVGDWIYDRMQGSGVSHIKVGPWGLELHMVNKTLIAPWGCKLVYDGKFSVI